MVFKQELITEQDIFNTINNLPPPPPEVEQKIIIEEDSNTIEVEVPPAWSLFKYMLKPDLKGLDHIRYDERPYYTIPSGYDVDEESLEMWVWFYTFPAGGVGSDISQFFVKRDVGLTAGRGTGGGEKDE